jgi:uncharacterized protein
LKPVLLDTGVIVALLDRSERHHAACVETIRQIRAPLVTCEAAIAESCYLLGSLAGANVSILENVAAGVFQIPLPLTACAREIQRILRKYRDRQIDLADACLIHLATELGTGKILTLDKDFNVYRWGRNNAFEPLVELN